MLRSALCLAALLAAGPASADDIVWGVPVPSEQWRTIRFDDINGKAQTVSYHASYLHNAEAGKDIPLYSMTALPPQGGVERFQARLSSFRAAAALGSETFIITVPGIAFACSHSEKYPKQTKPVLLTKKARTLVAVMAPVVDREEPAKTFFPSSVRPFRVKFHFPTLEKPKPGETVEMRIHRRFVPFEMLGAANASLQKPFDTVTVDEMTSGPAYIAAETGDFVAFDAWVKQRRRRVFAAAREQRAAIEDGAASRPEEFSSLEAQLLWTLVDLTGEHGLFFLAQEVDRSLATAETRKAFVAKYRSLLRAEIVRYLEGAVPLLADGAVPGPIDPKIYNDSWRDILSRVTRTMRDDADQLASNSDPTAPPKKEPSPAVIAKQLESPQQPQRKKAAVKDNANLDQMFGK
jgi:hypothetical protein